MAGEQTTDRWKRRCEHLARSQGLSLTEFAKGIDAAMARAGQGTAHGPATGKTARAGKAKTKAKAMAGATN